MSCSLPCLPDESKDCPLDEAVLKRDWSLIPEALGLIGQPGRLAVADRSGAPLHGLEHGQGFVGDHDLQGGAGALFGGGDRVVSFTDCGSTSTASFSRRRSRSAHSRRHLACGASDAASLPASLSACPLATSFIDQTPIPYVLSRRLSGQHFQRASRDVPPSPLRNVMSSTDP
jgi:hypothetical protein